MPIDPDVLREHLAAEGPHMFHVTDRAAGETMLKTGMRSRAEGSQSSERRGFFESRPGHVYLLTVEDAPVVPVDGEWALLRVDLRCLDPDRFDADEDLARAADLAGKAWVSEPTPVRQMASDNVTEREGQAGRLARWAEETPGFDAPEVVAKSLAQGRIAYRGSIDGSALEWAHERSEGAVRFRELAREKLSLEPSDLPGPPEVAYQDTEVERPTGWPNRCSRPRPADPPAPSYAAHTGLGSSRTRCAMRVDGSTKMVTGNAAQR